TIHAADLQLPAAMAHAPAPGAPVPAPGAPVAPIAPPPVNAAPGPDPRPASPFDTSSSALPSYIADVQRAPIQHALQHARHNTTRTAAALGSTFRALRYKLRKLGID